MLNRISINRRRAHSEEAFSLVELMIVIALMAIVASFAIPSFNAHVRRSNFRTAVGDVTSDLFFVKERAISDNRHYRLSFSSPGTTYTIDQGTSAGAPYATVQTKSVTNLAQDATIASANYSGNAFITCQPRGTCTAGNVQLTNAVTTATITTNNTGRTYVVYTGE